MNILNFFSTYSAFLRNIGSIQKCAGKGYLGLFIQGEHASGTTPFKATYKIRNYHRFKLILLQTGHLIRFFTIVHSFFSHANGRN